MEITRVRKQEIAKGSVSGWVCSSSMVKGSQAGFLGSPFPVQRQNLGTWALFQMCGSPASLQSNSPGVSPPAFALFVNCPGCPSVLAEEGVGSLLGKPAVLPPACSFGKWAAAGSLAWRLHRRKGGVVGAWAGGVPQLNTEGLNRPKQ